jgi:hypothetical protein
VTLREVRESVSERLPDWATFVPYQQIDVSQFGSTTNQSFAYAHSNSSSFFKQG